MVWARGQTTGSATRNEPEALEFTPDKLARLKVPAGFTLKVMAMPRARRQVRSCCSRARRPCARIKARVRALQA